MTFRFRTDRFDTASPIEDGAFRGRDAAEWLLGELRDWQATVDAEDWGWAVSGVRGEHACVFGIYDHDLDDVTADGPQWCLRIFNLRDRSVPWYKKLFRHVPPVAPPDVVAEIHAILTRQPDFREIRQEALG
jgi:hypothetical protein